MRTVPACAILFGLAVFGGPKAFAQESRFVLDREGKAIVIEPYAPNILRVTLATARPRPPERLGMGCWERRSRVREYRQKKRETE